VSEYSISEPVNPASDPQRDTEPADQSQIIYHWVILLGCAMAIGLSFGLSVVGSEGVEIAGLRWRLPGICVMHDVIGIDCPGCGLTRSFVSLAHGDWSRAWLFNPAGPLLFVFFAVQIPFRAIQLWRLRVGAEPMDSPWFYLPLWGIFGVMIVQWFARLIGWLVVA